MSHGITSDKNNSYSYLVTSNNSKKIIGQDDALSSYSLSVSDSSFLFKSPGIESLVEDSSFIIVSSILSESESVVEDKTSKSESLFLIQSHSCRK